MKTDELQALVKAAIAWHQALSPEQQREHRRAQMKSWVVGEMLLEHPNMTREYAESVYERVAK